MRHIVSLILLLSSLVSQAQQFKINYSKNKDIFGWTITQIEFCPNSTIVSGSICNRASETISFNLEDGAYLYSKIYPNGVKASNNSLRVTPRTKVLSLHGGESIPFVLTFPETQFKFGKDFSLRIGGVILRGIPLPEYTLADLNRQMQTWEQFYNAHKKQELTYHNIEEVETAVKKNVEEWQKKGEFESTATWQARVNDETRQKYISELISTFSEDREKEIQSIQQEQINLAKEYEKYKANLLDKYYDDKILLATSLFEKNHFELNPYDADNETFLIHSDSYGDILLPVPISEAPSFKQNWETIRKNIKPEFVPNGEEVALNKVLFNTRNKVYLYNSHTIAKYAITDINYNFTPIEITEINFADIEKIETPTIPDNITSPIVGVNNQNRIIAQTNVNPSIRRISASDKSDIDTSIPKSSELKNATTFAVIIANENYNSVSPVPYAVNDGVTLSKYLVNTLGLPREHVKVYQNATFGNIVGAMKHINNLSLAFGNKLNLIFYYAGHGVPNERTKQCMLLPIDGDALIPETCYNVEKLYTSLGELEANSVIVLMDACFSGSLRGDGMLYASRSVKIKSNQADPKGNMVILSASQGDETAFPFDKEQHGMFTYYLLKYLQDKKGDTTLGDLSEYLIEQVKQQSVISNGKLQTPMVQYSPELENHWRSWKLAN